MTNFITESHHSKQSIDLYYISGLRAQKLPRFITYFTKQRFTKFKTGLIPVSV
jgi:hypothetical protein